MKWKFLAFLFALFLIGIVILADDRSLPPFIEEIYNVPGGDKLGHFVLMGAMAFFANMALRGRTIKLLALDVLLGSLIVTVLVALEELSQNFFPGRTPSLGDFAASFAGIVALGWLSTQLTDNQ